jgi:hypothetical protein
MNQPQAYPLSWPIGWPRTKFPQQSRFLRPGSQTNSTRIGDRRHTIADASRCLFDELDRLKATKVVLSTNLVLKANGQPHGNQAQPQDCGAAVYFELRGKRNVLACDKWQHVQCNIYALSKHIEALRGQERWGVGSLERAFTGYLALEAQTQAKWFEVLGVPEHASLQVIADARRDLVRRYHPDGKEPDAEKFHQVGEAYRIACELRAQK